MSSYGMDHDEFTKATGLKDGDPVTLTIPGQKIKRAVIGFDWVGAGFCLVEVYYDSDKPGFADGSKYTHKRKRYAHSMTVHNETCHGRYPFNGLWYDHMEGIQIEANGEVYTRAKCIKLDMLRKREEIKGILRGLPDKIESLEKELSELNRELEKLSS